MSDAAHEGVPFISHDESHWEFKDNTDSGGLSVGIVSYQSGTLVLRDPTGASFSFAYRGLGPAYGLEIHLPLKIPGSKLLWLSVKGLTRGVRRTVNKWVERIGSANSKGGGFTADKANQELPESLHPSSGRILLGPACTGTDLKLDDFEGWCIFCNVDAGLLFGSSGSGMLVGLKTIKSEWWRDNNPWQQLPQVFGPRGTTGVNVLGNLSNMISPMSLAMNAVGQAKALILFLGTNFDFRAGGSASVHIGHMKLLPKQMPSGDILQMEMEMLNPSVTPDGREIT